MSTFRTEFAARMRDIRLKAGFSQLVLAKLVGVHVSTVRRVEGGDVIPCDHVIALWEKHTGRTVFEVAA